MSIPTFKASAIELAEIGAQFDAAPERIKTATRRAIAHATRWANDKIIGEMPELVGIRARVLKNRIRMEIQEASGRVWFGTNPISAKWLEPTQSGSGVSASGFSFPGAFIVDSLGGHVFKRRGKARLHIDKQEVTIAEKAKIAVRQIASDTEKQFFKEFRRQLKWTAN